MAIPSTYAPILPQDYTLTPFKVHPIYEVSESGSGYDVRQGYYTNKITPVSSSKAANDPRNTDGSFKHIVWRSFFHNYYRYPYESGKNLTNSNQNLVYKYIAPTASFLSIPYLEMGEKVKKKSLEITSSGIFLQDDGNGNIIDTSISTSSFYSRRKTIAHWSFSNLYREFKYGSGEINELQVGPIRNYPEYTIYSSSIDTANNLSNSPSLTMNSSSYVHTKNTLDIEFVDSDNFIMSMWIKPEQDGNVATMRTIKTVETGSLDRTWRMAEIQEPTNSYPFDVSISASEVIVKRSDGLRTITLSGSVNYDEWNLITIFSYSDKFGLRYPSGSNYESTTITDTTENHYNVHNLIFGDTQIGNHDGFVGSLAEVRIVKDMPFGDFHPESGSVATSSYTPHSYPYNTNIVGNIFYDYGDIVISPHYSGYDEIFTGDWNVKYKGTKTIFQYECLVRVRKGDFNFTENHSARKHYKSDELINEFTSSLTPYATTIGLYNSLGDLMAVGKLGQAVKMRDDVDINFLVRWDA